MGIGGIAISSGWKSYHSRWAMLKQSLPRAHVVTAEGSKNETIAHVVAEESKNKKEATAHVAKETTLEPTAARRDQGSSYDQARPNL